MTTEKSENEGNTLHFKLESRSSLSVVLFNFTVLVGVLGRLHAQWDTARVAPKTPIIMKIATAIDSTTSIVLCHSQSDGG